MVVYVGDSQVDDVLEAKAFGILTVWVNRKKEVLQESIPTLDFEISSLYELFSFL